MDKLGLQGKDPIGCSPARRCLFGPVDHQTVQESLRREVALIQERDRERWNFDFQKEKPLEGRYIWSSPTSHQEAESRGADYNVTDNNGGFHLQDTGGGARESGPYTVGSPGDDGSTGGYGYLEEPLIPPLQPPPPPLTPQTQPPSYSPPVGLTTGNSQISLPSTLEESTGGYSTTFLPIFLPLETGQDFSDQENQQQAQIEYNVFSPICSNKDETIDDTPVQQSQNTDHTTIPQVAGSLLPETTSGENWIMCGMDTETSGGSSPPGTLPRTTPTLQQTMEEQTGQEAHLSVNQQGIESKGTEGPPGGDLKSHEAWGSPPGGPPGEFEAAAAATVAAEATKRRQTQTQVTDYFTQQKMTRLQKPKDNHL